MILTYQKQGQKLLLTVVVNSCLTCCVVSVIRLLYVFALCVCVWRVAPLQMYFLDCQSASSTVSQVLYSRYSRLTPPIHTIKSTRWPQRGSFQCVVNFRLLSFTLPHGWHIGSKVSQFVTKWDKSDTFLKSASQNVQNYFDLKKSQIFQM